ncbi:MAG TPA: glutamate--tRNA ligase [Acidimicrobiia bacterium]|nr:glutamate--tRNA ligase [Acidimicrobiia bacterium]
MIRTRFAPSPTGYLHIGGVRSALFNWLFSHRHGGKYVLRIDDTDQQRNIEAALAPILHGFHWLGLDWDEGIEVGGPHGTYRQTDRVERYRQVAHEMVAAGVAYYDGATAEQLEAIRLEAESAGATPVYDGRHRLSEAEARSRIAAGDPPPVRLGFSRPGITVFDDVVRGTIEFDHANVDDFVVLRSDGSPIYHLASTVDDVDYGITHVIRGEDILPSTPKHLLITAAMGAPAPSYAHLSLLNGPDGKKLSKRHGDTALRAYRDAGFLPEALRNFLAILGWSPGEDEEIVSLDTMIERFDLGAVSRNPAVFDVAKLEWMNGQYLRAMAPGDFAVEAITRSAAAAGRQLTDGEQSAVTALAPVVQERVKRLTDIAPQFRFLLEGDLEIEQDSWDKVMRGPEAARALAAATSALEAVTDWSTASIEASLREMLSSSGLSAAKGLQPVRVAVSGSAVSPPLFESLATLGRDRSLERIGAALRRLSPQ